MEHPHNAAPQQIPPPQPVPISTPEQAYNHLAQQVQEQQQRMNQLVAANQQLQQQLLYLQEQKMPTDATSSPSSSLHSLTSGSRPSASPSKPDTYDGSRRAQADIWIFSLEQYFKATGVHDDQQQINYAAAQLRSSAATWWRRYSQAQTPATFAEFKSIFIKQFIPVASKETARATLHAMKQRNKAAGYCDAFTNCLLQLDSDDVSPADQLFLFKRGLHRDIAQQLHIMRPKTLEEAMSMAVQIEMENRNFSRGLREDTSRHGNYRPMVNGGNHGAAPMELGQMQQDSTIHSHERSNPVAATQEEYSTDDEEQQFVHAMMGAGKRLSPEQVKDYMRRGICFTCAKPGHLSRYCPTRNASNQRPRPSAQQSHASKK